MNSAPILFIDEDEDDQFMLSQVLLDLQSPHPLISFRDPQTALDYLRTSEENPFLIISEVKLPGMDGMEFRRQIDQDQPLRKKSIPFIFLTMPILDYAVQEAYELPVQGYFEKKSSYAQWKAQISSILDYWAECAHPKQFG